MDKIPSKGITRRAKPPAQINQSIRDAIECLLEIAAQERPIGSRELARRLGQNHSRINRIISMLSYMGLADQTPDRKYIAGSGLLVLASLSLRGSPLYRCAMPHLEVLGDATGYQVALGLRWRTNVSYLFHGHTQYHAALGIAAEKLYPASESSIGLALLAQLPREEVEQLYHQAAPHRSGTDIMQGLLEQLELVRRQGYAIALNHRSIAVALGKPAVAGIALYHSEGQPELPEDPAIRAELVKQLHATADGILLDISRG